MGEVNDNSFKPCKNTEKQPKNIGSTKVSKGGKRDNILQKFKTQKTIHSYFTTPQPTQDPNTSKEGSSDIGSANGNKSDIGEYDTTLN